MKFATLLIVYIALVLLLALTIGVAYLPVGASIKPEIGLLIAAGKALLIVLFFMEIKYRNGLVRIFAGAGVFWLLLLFLLTAADYFTRG